MAAGSKGVTTRGGGGSRSRGRSTVGRGGRSRGGGGRSSAGGGGSSSGGGGGRGKSNVGAGKSSKGGALRIPGVEGSLPASDPRENTPVGRGKGSAKGPDGRGKGPAKVVGGKVGPSRPGGGGNGGETSAGGGTPMGGRKSTHRISSLHDSNPGVNFRLLLKGLLTLSLALKPTWFHCSIQLLLKVQPINRDLA